MDDHCIHKVHAIFRAVIEFERALEDTFNMNINELMLLCMLANTESLLAGEIACEVQHNRKRTETDGTHQLQIVPHTTRPRRHHCTGMMRTTPGTTRPDSHQHTNGTQEKRLQT